MEISWVRKSWVWLCGTGDCFPLRLVPSVLLYCFFVPWQLRSEGLHPAVAACLLVTHSPWKDFVQFFILFSFAFFIYTLIHSFLLVSKWLVAWHSKISPFSVGWLLCTLTVTLFTCKNFAVNEAQGRKCENVQ